MVLTKEPIRVVLNSYRKIQTYYFSFYALLKVGVATTPPWRIYLTLPYVISPYDTNRKKEGRRVGRGSACVCGGGGGEGGEGKRGWVVPVYVRCWCNVLSTGGHIAIEGRVVQAAICGFPKVNTIMSVPVQPQDDYCLRVMRGCVSTYQQEAGTIKLRSSIH